MKKLRKPRFSTRAEVIKLAALSFDQTIWFFVSASYRVYVLQNLKGNSAALQFADPGERDNLDEAKKHPTPNSQKCHPSLSCRPEWRHLSLFNSRMGSPARDRASV